MTGVLCGLRAFWSINSPRKVKFDSTWSLQKKYGNLVNTNQYGLKQQGQKGGKRGLWQIQITENITGHTSSSAKAEFREESEILELQDGHNKSPETRPIEKNLLY